jgi:hypothetical protein
MQPPVEIENSNLVTDWFGFWPSFHDAEVIEINLHRSLRGIENGAVLSASVYAFQMTSEVDEKSFYKLIKNCVIELEFLNIDSLEVEDFNHQNALHNIEFSQVKNISGNHSISVDFNSNYGVSFTFTCSKVRVTSVTPGKPADDLHT